MNIVLSQKGNRHLNESSNCAGVGKGEGRREEGGRIAFKIPTSGSTVSVSALTSASIDELTGAYVVLPHSTDELLNRTTSPNNCNTPNLVRCMSGGIDVRSERNIPI